MLDPGTYAGSYEAESGRLCLDFVNTVSWRHGGRRHDWLNSYFNLVSWGQIVGLLTEEETQNLLSEAHSSAKTAHILEKAVALREALYRIFSTVAVGQPPDGADLEILNHALQGALAHIQIVWTTDGPIRTWMYEGDDVDYVLWPVAQSAADLLTSEDLGRVGECAGEGCGWLFFDTSRNKSRRWCAMDDCGNRAKARRHYRRSRVQSQNDEA